MKAILLAFVSLLFASGVAIATPFTPLQWQSVVDTHSNPALVGQRKLTDWVRDRNRNFIDDELERRFKPGNLVDVTIDLNRCLTPAEVERLLARFGAVRHVGKLVTFVLLDKVKFTDLASIAALPEVAMVEWRAPTYPEIDTASRAVAARNSSVYNSAQSQGQTGANVNIAIVDTGVDDGPASSFPSLRTVNFRAGFDATDPTDPGDGTRNPSLLPVGAPSRFHGSAMAAIALGRGVPGQTSRDPHDPGAQADCSGIAPDASLVDVKMYALDTSGNLVADPEKALDWIGTHASTFGIGVVDYSSARCGDDDGKSAFAQQANYLAALGVVFVAASGNAPGNCMPQTPAGGRITKAPASASEAIAVTGSYDNNTISRTDDAVFVEHFIGPRSDWDFMHPEQTALKPELAAPQAPSAVGGATSGGINIAGASPANGTSASAAVVAGAAALVIQQSLGTIRPESVKQALLTSADSTRNTPFSSTTGAWDSALGWGLLDVGTAISNASAQASNPRFVNCKTPSASGVGQLCELRNGNPPWMNDQDIQATTSPQVGQKTTISAHVINDGAFPATFLVNFGVYQFGVGTNQFIHIGTKVVTLAANTDQQVTMDWTPANVNHQCIQVTIASGVDKDYTDNVTQRNFQVLPSQYTMRVENPLFVRAKFDLEAKSHRSGWACKLSDQTFSLDPEKDCARDVTITFDHPAGAAVGQQADCDVAVYATPENGKERRLIGGVTVRTFVPRPCEVWGEVVDPSGQPVVGATVSAQRVTQPAGDAQPATSTGSQTLTDRYGMFHLTVAPGARHTFTVRKKGVGNGTLTLRPGCGLDLPRLVLTARGLQTTATPPPPGCCAPMVPQALSSR